MSLNKQEVYTDLEQNNAKEKKNLPAMDNEPVYYKNPNGSTTAYNLREICMTIENLDPLMKMAALSRVDDKRVTDYFVDHFAKRKLFFNAQMLKEGSLSTEADLQVSLSRTKVSDNPILYGKGILAQVDSELSRAQDRFDMAIHDKKKQPMTFSSEESMKSVGVKFDDDKCPYHLVPAFALAGTAWQFKYGATKYDDWNHSKGMPHSKQLRAALGHIEELKMGHPIDPETGIGHVYAAIASLMMLAENMVMYPEHNDLYPPAYIKKKTLLDDHLQETKVNMLKSIKTLKENKSK